MEINSRILDNKEDTYTTENIRPGFLLRTLPSLCFYSMATKVVIKASHDAARGKYDMQRWCRDSQEIANAVEAVGGRIFIDGLNNFRSLEGPCVIVANHMSTLETFVLPSILQPVRDVAFVIKRSLTEYPIFKHVIRASTPITVSRNNPREDLKTVFEEGARMLSEGRSIIIFPQTTRTEVFDPKHFNTIGAKLAARTGVPIIPIALYTAFWSNGKILKDYGAVYPERKIRFSIGRPIHIQGKGNREHQETVDFIRGRQEEWAAEDGR
ncbi:lysophospholipid acyltransferase family protein [Nitrospirota bacterium]